MTDIETSIVVLGVLEFTKLVTDIVDGSILEYSLNRPSFCLVKGLVVFEQRLRSALTCALVD